MLVLTSIVNYWLARLMLMMLMSCAVKVLALSTIGPKQIKNMTLTFN